MEGRPVQYVTTRDGVSVAYTVEGSGDTVVLLPGPFSHRGLPSQQEGSRLTFPLADRFRAVRYDSRGQGLSTRGLPDNHSVSDHLADLEAVIERTEARSVTLIGSIIFWRVAVHYAAEHPERCRGLVLVRPDHPVQASKLPRSPFEDMVSGAWDQFLHSLIASYPLARGARPRIGELKQAISQADYLKMIRASHLCDASGWLRSVKAPTLVISERAAGVDDAESLSGAAYEIASLLADARLSVFEGYGTAFAVKGKEPSAGLRLIWEFIESLPSEATAAERAGGHSLSTATDTLSSREIEVLRLLAMGKSNAQIAEALVISPNTVNRHVSNIYSKTGAANRAEAASYATRSGIV